MSIYRRRVLNVYLPVLNRLFLVVTEQTAGGIIVPATGRLVACLGVDDLVIVDTQDALLVTTRARSQEVSRVYGLFVFIELMYLSGQKTCRKMP